MLLPTLLALLPLAEAPGPTAPDLERSARTLAARDARSRALGSWIPAATGTSLAGKEVDWRACAGERGTVLALVSVTCPVGQKLFPEIARAEARARELGFGFVHVGAEGLDDAEALAAHADRFGLEGTILQDARGELARALDARTTTEVFVIDERGTLRYRGAINDQYGVGFALPEARSRYLDDALVAVAEGGEVAIPATTAPGCALERPSSAEPEGPAVVTYAREVSRMMRASCVECHTAGGVAPFALDSYSAVSKRATMLLDVIDEGLMPPWFAAHAGDAQSPWRNDRSLLPGERDILRRWIEAGKPEGEMSELPLPLPAQTDPGWSLGEPDLVFELPRAFDVPAEGRVDYQYFTVPTGVERDTWIRAIEVRPGAIDVVHHVLAYALPPAAFENGRLKRWDLVDERRGFFAAWAPGAEPAVCPDGHARLLPAGTVLLLELHYTPNGIARKDRSAIGVHFASEDPDWMPERIVRTAGISNRSFRIPAGAEDHVDTAVGVATRPMRVLSFMPHMHLRGKSFLFERVGADGERSTLLDVPQYDFNWQLTYTLNDPIQLNAGERIDVRALFDNSAANPANPNPKRRIGWGPETDDEMLIGFVDYVLSEEDLSLPGSEPQFVVLEPRIQTYLRALAKASGGAVLRDKLPAESRASFDQLDQNSDGQLDATELTILDAD